MNCGNLRARLEPPETQAVNRPAEAPVSPTSGRKEKLFQPPLTAARKCTSLVALTRSSNPIVLMRPSTATRM
jgi:hypothetical protein